MPQQKEDYMRRSEATMNPLSETELWQQIDVSESYLVCCMFKDAASLASSIIRRTHTTTEALDEAQLAEMRESAGMVFVQSLKELGRTSELFIELQMLFGSIAAIPVQVFLTGVCMQIDERMLSNLQAIFEEFLGKWTHLEDEVYVSSKGKTHSSSEGNMIPSAMHSKKYVEVAEVYAITFLGMILHNPDLAISWTEKAVLPEDNRQDILRRLHSMHFTSEPSSSLDAGSIQAAARVGEGLSKPTKQQIGDKHKQNTSKSIIPAIERIPCFRWFRTVRLRYGNVQLVVPCGKTVFWGLLVVLAYSFARKRSAALKRTVARQASYVKRVVSDAWQLAFSVNVNPLAAVQQLPAAPRGIGSSSR